MPNLAIHTRSGHTVTAPFEAWVVAIVDSLPYAARQELLKRIATMQGASLISDRFQIGEDELGTITIVDRPTIDLGGRI